MGERSYLAIGDVLALLREEFPDVTISKIRFLESRGLLVPERTPSGYRKFYEPDVERLRWILRQQREHFLPLKVIKGRLDHGMTDPGAPAPPLFEMGDPPPEREPEPVLVGAPAAVNAAEESAAAARAPFAPIGVVGSPGSRPPAGEPSGQANGEGAPRAARSSRAGEVNAAREAASGSVQGSAEDSPEPEVTKAVSAPQGASAPRRPRRHSTQPGPEAGSQAAGEGPVADAAPHDEAKPASRPAARSTAGVPGASVSGASLTVAEVASASGLDVEGVEELESFGLIAGRMVAGVPCYDEEAVLVAKLAAGFAPYGIEARHLRIFKHAVDRQTGLYAQVITPLLRQRNPEARARAIEGLSELAELGEALMRCFSQATLRELTGG